MKKTFVLFAASLLTLLFARFVFAAEIKTTVKYLSSSAIYIDAGRTQGIALGDRADVRRDDKLVAILEVQFVADNSASCRLLESVATIQVGDEVIVHTSEETTPEPQKPTDENTKPTPEAKPRVKGAPKVNRVSGHVGVGMMWQDDRKDLSFDFSEPSLSLRLRVENLLATRHTLSIRLRGRRTQREREFGEDTRSQWTGRVYEVSLYYENPDSPYRYGMGRVLTNRLRGIGYFDGALFDYRMNEHVTVGAFGGAQPDPRTTDVSGDETKFGVYGSYETGTFSAHRLQSTLALAGRYVKGNVSREFVYQQIDYFMGPKLAILESAELNINRDWQKNAGASSLEFANWLVTARYMATHDLTATLSYDTRTNYRTWETRDTPDSLFDDSRRQGIRGGLAYAVSRVFYANANGGLMSGGSQPEDTKTGSFGATMRNGLWQGLTAAANVNVFSNAFTHGNQPSLSLTKYFGSNFLAGVQVGRNTYDFRSEDRAVSNDWIKLQTEAYFTRRIYGSAYFESYKGDSPSLNRLFLETGIRF